MVTAASTAITNTFTKGIALNTTFSTNSNTYVDVTSFSISSVPNGSKIYYSFNINKVTAGTMDMRLTDGTNVFWEETGISGTNNIRVSLDGSNTQNSGGAATVKLQILSSDANNAQVRADSNGTSWFIVTDMSGADPLVFAPSSTSTYSTDAITFNGKRQIDTLNVLRMSGNQTNGDFDVNVMGYNVEATPETVTVTENSFSPNVLTNEIKFTYGTSTPVFSDTISRGAVIITYSGYNIEVTG